ncbi:hypothetical protein IE077_001846, partial [Cardiosporidium cionae]
MNAPEVVQRDDTANPVEEIVHQVASDLELNYREHLDVQLQLHKAYIRSVPALKDAIQTGRLACIVHPFIAERISERIFDNTGGFVDFDEEEQPSIDVANPAKFLNPAIFIHRIAPVPGTFKGRIICTWALDICETARVTDILDKLSAFLNLNIDTMRLIFNGVQLKMTNTLADYDIRGGDTMYLYTLSSCTIRNFDGDTICGDHHHDYICNNAHCANDCGHCIEGHVSYIPSVHQNHVGGCYAIEDTGCHHDGAGRKK